MTEEILANQKEYYRLRAGEYDDWFLRVGRYDHGAEANARWWREVGLVETALQSIGPLGRVLELAAGTGIWTEKLAAQGDSVTAVDRSAEVLEINRRRNSDAEIAYLQADLFEWRPRERFDTVFFGFWLSHVPSERFNGFWELVRTALNPGGRVFFVDSLQAETSGAIDHADPDAATGTARRRLADGLEFTIVKFFYEPEELSRRLSCLGWQTTVSRTPTYFLYGHGVRETPS